MKELNKWNSRLKLRRISTLAILLCLILSAATILLTIYGSNVGNFVISIEEKVHIALSLSEDKEFTNPSSLLTAKGLRETTHSTYRIIPDDIENGDGAKNDEQKLRYMAYSFYIKNLSPKAIDYTMQINIVNVYKNADSAIWIMVIKDSVRQVYAKAERYENGVPVPETGGGVYPGLTTPFWSDSIICLEDYYGFGVNETAKFTVVLWIEGEDPECTDDIKGGTMQLEMKFNGRD